MVPNKFYRPFRSGLVVGKFSPLHNGHLSLISAAAERCDHLTIIAYSEPQMDNIANWMEVRYWLKCATMSLPCKVKIITPEGGDSPSNDESPEAHRSFCATLLSINDVIVDAVFSNETYGEGLAEYIQEHQYLVYGEEHTPKVTSITFDIPRKNIPISATVIREKGPLSMKDWLPSYVRASYIPRIVFMGGESSGKTTTAKALTSALNMRNDIEAKYVPEYGRTLYEALDGNMWFSDFQTLIEEQVKSERAAANYLTYSGSNNEYVLVCDTNALTTQWYMEQWYNPSLYVANMQETIDARHYDLYVICDPNIPFEQDGTRANEAFRSAHYDWLEHKLKGKPQLRVTGSTEDRVNQVLAHLRQSMELW